MNTICILYSAVLDEDDARSGAIQLEKYVVSFLENRQQIDQALDDTWMISEKTSIFEMLNNQYSGRCGIRFRDHKISPSEHHVVEHSPGEIIY